MDPSQVKCMIVQPGHNMDSAGSDPLSVALQTQGQRIHHQEEQLNCFRLEIKATGDRQEGLISAFGSQVNFLVEQVQEEAQHSASCLQRR